MDSVTGTRQINANHWLERSLTELEAALTTAAGMFGRLEEQCRHFDRHLCRLKRLRNAAIHGGPISESACTSVAIFAHNLGHQCLNEVMAALLAGREIADHMAEYRADHIDRYERVRKSGDIDALFVDREEPSVHDEN